MKPAECAALSVLLIGLSSVAIAASSAGQGPNPANHRGGQAASHMSSKGSANNHGQWSADPERGWVRDDDRRGSKDRRDSTRQVNPNKAKPKDQRNKS